MPTLLLINPAAGRKGGIDNLSQCVRDRFARENEPLEIIVPNSVSDHLENVRRAHERGFDKLLVAGGDGSVHLSLQDLDFENVALGIIPFGSGNDIYRAFCCPIKLEHALDNFFSGEERVDLGRAAGRWFLNSAGCGLDTWTVEAKEQSTGRFSNNYLFLFLKLVRSLKPLNFEVTIDGKTIHRRGYWAIATNNGYIGGGMKVSPDANITDGFLDVLIAGDFTKLGMIMQIPHIFKGTHINNRKIEVFRGTEVIIDTDPQMNCAMDGELHGRTPLDITLHPKKLRLRGRLPNQS